MRLKRFTKPNFLKEIGRELLGRFLSPFVSALTERKIPLPAPDLRDDEYFGALSRVAMSPDGLPDDMIEALYSIEEMATEEGQERLERAISQGELALKFGEKSSRGDIAMQAYLAAPELLAEKSNEMRLARLSSFEYYGCKTPVDRSGSFVEPPPETLALVTADLNAWFTENNRGEQTVYVEPYAIEGEFWFLVRHGDTFARLAKLEKGKLKMLHFRPAKDDVVVYSPKRDEIRIHAGTKGERELYQRTFGQRLFGEPKYFSERKAFTLEPLREDGPTALDMEGVGGIDRAVLREYEISFGGAFNTVVIRKEDDIFESAEARGQKAIPDAGRVVRATFDVYFEGEAKPRRVQVRPPNALKLGRYCDAGIIQRWLSEKKFRDVTKPEKGAALPYILPPPPLPLPASLAGAASLVAAEAAAPA